MRRVGSTNTATESEDEGLTRTPTRTRDLFAASNPSVALPLVPVEEAAAMVGSGKTLVSTSTAAALAEDRRCSYCSSYVLHRY